MSLLAAAEPGSPRERMVREHLAARGIQDARVLDAMLRVPREAFVPAFLTQNAYDDRPLYIGYEQTISQPYIVALMTEALQLKGQERVLEVGTGSGYQTAILALLCAEVYTIERIRKLSIRAQTTLRKLGITNVQFRVGDGALGWPEAAPFDAILVTAGASELPRALAEQLAEGGRLVIPIGPLGSQTLHRFTRKQGQLLDEKLTRVAFVPLISETEAGQPSESPVEPSSDEP
ncbi:MAG: protein-L-isoaspartate(D-aspartate) O-methyltransferase [Gemmatales bacterium]|nr:protein-L-isoaspartate(D-aspartate) O-methyltransferase [Gemmatales bacterium]MDW8388282.1 protein-L-isoaspartate(D-aspartate) O-methyltransferase [Gemmatales bacterium]